VTDLEKYLAEVKKRAEAATPGPWQRGGSGTVIADVGGDISFDVIAPNDIGVSKELENREFIIHCRTDIPRLVEMVETVISAHYSYGFICNVCQGGSVTGARKHTQECWIAKMEAELDRLAAGGTQ